MPRYPLIYMDPPWPWKAWSQDTSMDRAPMYPTMTMEDIFALKIPAADDCVLWLWTTAPLDRMAHKLIEALGFQARTHIIWNKGGFGTGFWVRGQHEILHIAVKGKIPAPAPGTQPRSVIQAKPGKHSEKPEVFAQMIEEMFPTLPKLEMFARKKRPGWAAWGNEVEDQ
jgi:N6-adenosine-specific RNA methylase IME4